MQARAELIRFGVFELDRSTNELRKNGRKLKVQEQPLRLLYLLLDNPGQPVSREAMKAALWPADTFVDFDHSLNAAIAKLRQALGDPAGNPRFVETVARKGYRFIAPLELTGNAVASDEPLRPVELPSAAANFRKMNLVWIAVASVVLTCTGVWLLPKRAFNETKLIRVTEDAGLTTDPAVSSDGKLLAYASDRNSAGNLEIWIQQLGPKGGSIQLTHDSVDADQPSFSPDGSKIAFRSAKDGGGIYVIPVIGGEPSRLVPFGRSPRFSPDGRWVAFGSGAMTGGGVLIGNGTGGVFVVPVGGGEPVRLGRDVPAAASPTWSPDGRSLLVYGFPEKFGKQNDDWWVVPLDGSASRPTGSFEALRRQGFSADFDQLPRVADWRAGSITFVARYGDSVNLWRAPFSESGHIGGLATRLTSGTTFEVAPAMGSRGELFFASVNRTLTVWSLTGDPNRPPLRGEFRRLTRGPADLMPSISADGTKLAFSSVREVDSGKGRTHVLDLSTGKLTVFPEMGDVQWHPQISRDGSQVSYKSDTPGETFVAPVSGVSPKQLKTPGNIYSWNWSLDNRRLLYSAGDKMFNQHIRVVDVVTGRDQDLISSPRLGFFQAKFSPDDQALSVLGCDNDDRAAVQQCRIFIVPLENSLPVSSDRWIGIDHISHWDDKPRWSPNGSLLYFVSDRDGHLCLWAQRLNHWTKQLDGSPFAVYHLHNARLSLSNMDMHNLEIDVSTDKIVLGLGELTGDIWSLKSNR